MSTSSSPAAADIHVVTSSVVACDGNVALGAGHPRVFLTLEKAGEIVCPYCSRTFKLAEGAKVGHGH